MKTFTQEQINDILEKHKLWLCGTTGGERADLSDADLSDANLSDANLRDANLRDAGLSRADLRDADLSDADLSDANLSRADLSDANLSRADLRDADLSDADLSDANLRDADLFDTIGNKREIKTLQTEKYTINFYGVLIQIGCKKYKASQWENFTDDKIADMDGGALEWWQLHKSFVLNSHKLLNK